MGTPAPSIGPPSSTVVRWVNSTFQTPFPFFPPYPSPRYMLVIIYIPVPSPHYPLIIQDPDFGHVKTTHPFANSILPKKKQKTLCFFPGLVQQQGTPGTSPSAVHIPWDRDKAAVQVPTSLSNPPFQPNQFLGLNHSGRRVGNCIVSVPNPTRWVLCW